MRYQSIRLALMIALIIMVVSCAGSKAKRSSIMSNNEEGCGCGVSGKKMIMTFKWQRLVSGGATCPRCEGTEQELKKAIDTLGQSLALMGIKIVVEKDSLSTEEFKKNPLFSNRIWINDRPLEDYVSGKTGQSPCCDVCGPVECRTLEVEDQTFETIPSEVIIRAGLIAASQMIASEKGEPCCPDEQ